MGFERTQLTVSATVSRHNSDADRRDDLLWEDLSRRVRELAADPRYDAIMPDVD